MFDLDIDNEHYAAKIKVIGVGGCGGNIVNCMHSRGVNGVQYAAMNTDTQALSVMNAEIECLQIGDRQTGGLGSGARPPVAAEAARSETDRLREMISGMDMLFLVAGMGKGTGTGAAPVVAEIARELKVLTVAVVTRPFTYERRDKIADSGIELLAQSVDSLIVVPNARLLEVLGEDQPVKQALLAANDVLFNAVSGISEIITKPGMMNVDFNDVRSVMSAQGKAVIGSSSAAGSDRALEAAEAALRCPLMEDVDLTTASHVLVNITGHEDSLTMAEIGKIQDLIGENVPNCENAQFTGVVLDPDAREDLRVTIIVTGVRNAFEVSAGGKAGKPLELTTPNDSTFVSGRNRQTAGGGKDVPTVLRRQVS